MKKRVARRPCTQVLSSPPMVVNGAFAPLPWRTMGKRCQRLLKIGWSEQALIPGKRGIEIVHQACGEYVRIASGEGVERLRGDGVEDRIDRIGVGGLKSGVGLKPEPGDVFRIDVVIDAGGLHLFAIVAGMGNALAVRATISIGGIA